MVSIFEKHDSGWQYFPLIVVGSSWGRGRTPSRRLISRALSRTVLFAMVVRPHKDDASHPESTKIARATRHSSSTTVNQLKRDKR